MKIILGTDALSLAADVLVLFISEKTDLTQTQNFPELAVCVQKFGKNFMDLAEREQFTGKSGQILSWNTSGTIAAKQLLLVGLDVQESSNICVLKESAANAGRWCKEHHVKEAVGVIPGDIAERFGADSASQAVTIGFMNSMYVFNKYKHQKSVSTHQLQQITVTVTGDQSAAQTGITRGVAISEAIQYARDLINEPASVTTPAYLAHEAEKLGTSDGRISAEILGPSEMQQLGMGALLAIARGSTAEPRFIILRYRGKGKRTVAIAGKGITFDTGGLSLKSADGMETMKLDMSGASAVLALFRLLPQLQPAVNVVGIIPATENMPGPDAVKPGDIAVAMNGKTIEILNTDAEGRVVLADALSYAAQKIKPDVIIDIATLTGACMVALGTDVAGLFSNDKALAQQLLAAADKSGEKVWELPLVVEYRKLLDSTVADIKNIAGRYGGAITGALFIQDFVPAQTQWAHLDIAGPSFAEKDTPLTPRGGTGFGIQMLAEYLMKAE